MSIRNFKFKFRNNKDNIVEFKCEDILRVIIHNEKGVRLDKTWLVAPGMEDIPFEGRDRFDTLL